MAGVALLRVLGVSIFEDTPVVRIAPGRRGRQPEVVTVGASVHADYVVRATEGFKFNVNLVLFDLFGRLGLI